MTHSFRRKDAGDPIASQEPSGWLGRAGLLFREAFREWKEDDALAWGAALAFYSVLSLAPLLLVTLAIVGMVWAEGGVEEELVSQARELVGDAGAETARSILSSTARSERGGIAALLGTLMILLAASGVFAQLQKALNRMWDVTPDPDAGLGGLLRARLTAIGLVLAVGFLLLVSLVASAVLAAASRWAQDTLPIGSLALPRDLLLSRALATLMFALIFKVLPDIEIAWRDVWFGAVATALLFAAGKLLIGLYLGRSSVGSAYGAAGSLIVVLVWIYYSAQILFFGAELTQVWARRWGSRIRPSDHAVALDAASAPAGRARRSPPG